MSLYRSRAARLLAIGAVILTGLLVTAPALAYIIILKDGTRIEAKEKPSVRGKDYIYLTPLGSPQSIPVTEVDQDKTDAYNKQGVGNAYVLENSPDQRVLPPPPERKTNLSEYIKTHKKSEIIDPTAPKPTEPSAAASRITAAPGAKKSPGKPDEPVVDSGTSDALARALDASNIHGAHVSPIAGGVRLTAVTDTEPQVFAALMATARGLKEARANGRSVDKVDLFLATSTNENAGHFLISPEDAEALLNGKVSVSKYFMDKVVF